MAYSELCAMKCSKDPVTEVNPQINYFADEVQKQAINDGYTSWNSFFLTFQDTNSEHKATIILKHSTQASKQPSL